jgi:hypothetical protein
MKGTTQVSALEGRDSAVYIHPSRPFFFLNSEKEVGEHLFVPAQERRVHRDRRFFSEPKFGLFPCIGLAEERKCSNQGYEGRQN